MGWVAQQHTFIPLSSGGWKSKVKVPGDSMPGTDSPLGLQRAIISLHPHMAERATELSGLFSWGTNPILGHHTVTSSKPNGLTKTLPPSPSSLGLWPQCEFGGDRSIQSTHIPKAIRISALSGPSPLGIIELATSWQGLSRVVEVAGMALPFLASCQGLPKMAALALKGLECPLPGLAAHGPHQVARAQSSHYDT
jgi:hypothetical protein